MKSGEWKDVEVIFQKASRTLEGGTDEGTRKSTLTKACPFLAILVQLEAAKRYKPVPGVNPGGHWEDEEKLE
jgi:hypothetical protein